jgi:hypothetical protein
MVAVRLRGFWRVHIGRSQTLVCGGLFRRRSEVSASGRLSQPYTSREFLRGWARDVFARGRARCRWVAGRSAGDKAWEVPRAGRENEYRGWGCVVRNSEEGYGGSERAQQHRSSGSRWTAAAIHRGWLAGSRSRRLPLPSEERAPCQSSPPRVPLPTVPVNEASANGGVATT